jgi:hypothetical protein
MFWGDAEIKTKLPPERRNGRQKRSDDGTRK